MANSIITINPARIKWCCEQVRTDMRTLAAAVRIPQAKLETGKVTFKQLVKVARYFDYTLSFFGQKGVPAKGLQPPIFRAIVKQGDVPLDANLQKIIRRAHQQREYYISHMEEMGKPLTFTPPVLSGPLHQKARQAYAWLGLEDDVVYGFDDYRRAVEQRGILVFCSQAYRGNWQLSKESKVMGFCMPHEQMPLIFIRRDDEKRQIFTLFHELGHILLHGKGGYVDSDQLLFGEHSDRKENEANAFALACLPVDDDGWSRGDYVRVRGRGGAPAGRCRYREPLSIFGEGYVRTMLDARRSGEFTIPRLMRYLDGLNGENLQKLERFVYG